MKDLTKAKQILQKASAIEKVGSVALAKEFVELNDKLDSLTENISEELKKKVTDEFVLEFDKEELKGQDGKDGADGKDYTLTEKDKKEIASSIKVPIVEKVIEKTEVIKEPIVTNEIKEVAVSDTGEEIVNKINDLEIKPELQIDAKHIKNLPEFKGNRYYGGSGIKEIIAGTGISVDNSNLGYPVISSTVTGAVWGSITGNLSDQTDLQSALDSLVPYTGATGNVDLGTNYIKTYGLLDVGSGITALDMFNRTINDASNVPALVWDARKLYDGSGNQNLEWYNAGQIRIGNTNGAIFDTSLLTANHTYLTPDSDGTLALLSDIPSLAGYVPYSGAGSPLDLNGQNLTNVATFSASNITGTSITVDNSGGSALLGVNGSTQSINFTDTSTKWYILNQTSVGNLRIGKPTGDDYITLLGSGGVQINKNVSIIQGTITTDLKALDISSTWNASGVAFTGIKLNVTQTASSTSSLLMDLQRAGTSVFKVARNGATTIDPGSGFGTGSSNPVLTLRTYFGTSSFYGDASSILHVTGSFYIDGTTYIGTGGISFQSVGSTINTNFGNITNLSSLTFASSGSYSKLYHDYNGFSTQADQAYIVKYANRSGGNYPRAAFQAYSNSDSTEIPFMASTQGFMWLRNSKTDEVVLTLKAASSQTANIQEWQNSSGSVLALIDKSGGAVFNEQGDSSADFRIEGDTNTNLFFTDASADKVGIKTNTPAYDFDVNGDINATAYRVGGTAGASGTFTTADAKTVTVTNGIITSIV